ncbi:MAG: class I SAM-dependent methyltransferase, partial [Thermoanaerobaculia bacterium]
MSRTRLHIGCGPQVLSGWTNVDNQAYPGIDHVLDVTIGLPFANVEYVFAEHFVEHLAYDDTLNFLRECRRVLAADGVLRASTPNLDWVLRTHYHPELWKGDADAVRDCFNMNRAFKGWGHQFLYNRQSLAATLRLAGFGRIEECLYGESTHEALRGLERHETYPDEPTLPHVLVME